MQLGIAEYSYLFLLASCAITSITNPVARKEKWWLYFGMALVVEVYAFFFQHHFKFYVYTYAGIAYNIILIYCFLKQRRRLMSALLALYAVALVYIFFNATQYDKADTISTILIYQFLALFYFKEQIQYPDSTAIYKKQKFWVSTGIFIWSVMYAFNSLPIYFFTTADRSFMIVISHIFHITTILTYVIFQAGLLCKYK